MDAQGILGRRAYKRNRKGLFSLRIVPRFMTVVGTDLHYRKRQNAVHYKTVHLLGLQPTPGPMIQGYWTICLNDRQRRILAFVNVQDRNLWLQVLQRHTAVVAAAVH